MVESSRRQDRNSYHTPDGLERAVLDLVRVGVSGHGNGVRQLASRLVRAVPQGVEDPDAFRSELHSAMSADHRSVGLRFAGSDLPVDSEGSHPLVEVDSAPQGDGLVLAARSMIDLEEIVAERVMATDFARSGVELTRTVLLSGPPGVGKTLAARWLAQSVGLPLVSLDLSAVVSSYLGTSGRNIRSVLDYAKSGRCVLLLDEFDAIAKRRDDETDIGELKRIVNVILVELDRWPDTSLLVAATNHPHLLDPAVGRRFDRQIDLPLPGLPERERLVAQLAIDVGGIDSRMIKLIAELTDGSNCSDLERFWRLCRRKAIIRDAPIEVVLIDELAWQEASPGPERDLLWLMVKERLGLSHRQIAEVAGVSHPTVSSAIRRAKASK